MDRIKKMLILEEEKDDLTEELVEKVVPTSTEQRFRLLFLSNSENKTIHKVEVRNLNFQDLMRPLRTRRICFH